MPDIAVNRSWESTLELQYRHLVGQHLRNVQSAATIQGQTRRCGEMGKVTVLAKHGLETCIAVEQLYHFEITVADRDHAVLSDRNTFWSE